MTEGIWRALCLDKKRRQQEAIPKDWLVVPPPESRLDVLSFPRESGLLSSFELEITESSVETILRHSASGEWLSVDVTRAFYKRAIVAHQVVNCLTEIFVERALSRAAELDAHLKNTGKVVGPLHGLPVSLKDQLSIKGLETTMGYASWIGKYADQDATLVQILYKLGAVPFVCTNVPQALMWAETVNHVFGRTSNPFNRSLTSGGSSGGEGALIGLYGSPLGVGSDTGGSIRIPSTFNGLYGLRPSCNRIPYRGAANGMEGEESVSSVFGPISGSLFGVKLFMKVVINAKPWCMDPLMIRKPWDEQSYELVEHGNGHELVFAILYDDAHVLPHPPILRALDMTRDALIAAGHKVIDWKPHQHTHLCDIVRSIWKTGVYEEIAAITSAANEPIIETMALDLTEHTSSNELDTKPASASAYELWQLHKRRRELRNEYLDHWEATTTITGTGRPVDAIIAPVAPFAAPPHGKVLSCNYTVIWSALDYPSLAFPVTTVDPVLDITRPAHEFLSREDKLTYEMYDPETFKNAPVGLQIVGRRHEEEAVLGMAEIVDNALRSQQKKMSN